MFASGMTAVKHASLHSVKTLLLSQCPLFIWHEAAIIKRSILSHFVSLSVTFCIHSEVKENLSATGKHRHPFSMDITESTTGHNAKYCKKYLNCLTNFNAGLKHAV